MTDVKMINVKKKKSPGIRKRQIKNNVIKKKKK